MERRARLLGHAVHPILIVFPLGLLSTSVIFDFLRLVGGGPTFTAVASWMIATGLTIGVVATFFGWIEWLIIPRTSRAKNLALMHGIVSGVVLLFYAASLYVRSNDPAHPEIASTVFSTVGAGFALVGAWLGGELTERLDAPVPSEANVDSITAVSLSS